MVSTALFVSESSESKEKHVSAWLKAVQSDIIPRHRARHCKSCDMPGFPGQRQLAQLAAA